MQLKCCAVVLDSYIATYSHILNIIYIYILFLSIILLFTEQIKLLTGFTADPDFLNKITWISVQHDSRIQQIDTVRAYHFGNNYIVEV